MTRQRPQQQRKHVGFFIDNSEHLFFHFKRQNWIWFYDANYLFDIELVSLLEFEIRTLFIIFYWNVYYRLLICIFVYFRYFLSKSKKKTKTLWFMSTSSSAAIYTRIRCVVSSKELLNYDHDTQIFRQILEQHRIFKFGWQIHVCMLYVWRAANSM